MGDPKTVMNPWNQEILNELDAIDEDIRDVHCKMEPLEAEVRRLCNKKLSLFPVERGDMISWKCGKRTMRGVVSSIRSLGHQHACEIAVRTVRKDGYEGQLCYIHANIYFSLEQNNIEILQKAYKDNSNV